MIDPSRLYTILQRTGIRSKQPVLYQLLYELIKSSVGITDEVKSISGSSSTGTGTSSITNVIQNYMIQSSEIIENNNYMMLGVSTSGASGANVYDSILTNGNPAAPEIIFDSNGDVIVTQVPL
jgi:hypothetical protein